MTGNSLAISQVDEVSEQVKPILTAATIVVDIDLRLAFYVLVIDIVVMFLVVHQLLQIMVVGHAKLDRLGVSLTQTGLCIVCNPIVVLIPV